MRWTGSNVPLISEPEGPGQSLERPDVWAACPFVLPPRIRSSDGGPASGYSQFELRHLVAWGTCKDLVTRQRSTDFF